MQSRTRTVQKWNWKFNEIFQWRLWRDLCRLEAPWLWMQDATTPSNSRKKKEICRLRSLITSAGPDSLVGTSQDGSYKKIKRVLWGCFFGKWGIAGSETMILILRKERIFVICEYDFATTMTTTAKGRRSVWKAGMIAFKAGCREKSMRQKRRWWGARAHLALTLS